MITVFLEFFNDFFQRFWKPICIALLFIATFFAGCVSSQDHWQAPLKKEIKELKAKIASSEEKASKAQADSKVQKDLSEKQVESLKAKLDEVTTSYSKMKKTPLRTIKVIVKDKPVEVSVDEKNEVVCEKFHPEFQESVNKMIEESQQ